MVTITYIINILYITIKASKFLNIYNIIIYFLYYLKKMISFLAYIFSWFDRYIDKWL